MKRFILIAILLGLIGWTTYEFMSDSTEETEVDKTSSKSGAAIKTPRPDEEEQKEEAGETKDADKGREADGTGDEAPEVGLNVGDLAPDFELENMSGQPVKLSELRGKKVMVNFWATWCPPCREEIPEIKKFHEETDVEIVAVNLTETEKSVNDIRAFMNEYEMNFPVVLDESLDVATLYRIQPIPSSFMLDTEGVIQFYAPGAMYYEHMLEIYNTLD